MSDKVECGIHGEQEQAFVCSHLSGKSYALGFNTSEESDSPFPDAWCDDCEMIRAANGGWNDESEALISVQLICASCYRRTRACNTRPAVTLNDLADMRWKCSSCDAVHTGPCLDFGFDHPHYWEKETQDSHCNEDFCSIKDTDFFVRGVIELPITGTNEVFQWGVWGSLSKASFQRVLDLSDSDERSEVPAMFSWLSSQITDYPDTLSLKMYAHIQSAGRRPTFELEPTDHPLAKQQLDGILPSQIREIMLARLKPE